MKKRLIFFLVLMQFTYVSFSQKEANVWYFAHNCGIMYSIYDDFNQVPIYTNEVVSNIALTEHDIDIPVPLVEDNCELLNETYRPNYVIHVTVKMYCKDSSLTYEVICSGNSNTPDKTCYDFNEGIVTATLVELNPVD